MVQDYIIADEIARLQSLTKEELVSEIVSLKFDNNKTYEIISKLPNVNVNNFQNRLLNQIIKSSQNPSFDYNAITRGIPTIEAGNYSLVPKIVITKIYKNSFANYLLNISFDL